jgi:predicted acylesterase/phospholipase RssA
MVNRYILSCDGGGAKGMFQALILSKLKEYGIKFDLIIGVSIGAMNGILYAQDTYNNKDVFSRENIRKFMAPYKAFPLWLEIMVIIIIVMILKFLLNWTIAPVILLVLVLYVFLRYNTCYRSSITTKTIERIQSCPVYSYKGRHTAITTFLNTKTLGELKTKTAIISYNVNTLEPVIFRSWEDVNTPVYDVAMSTSAAPIYYPPYKYLDQWYVDGAVAINNPSLLGFMMGIKLFPGDDICVFSIGAGGKPDLRIKEGENLFQWGGNQWISRGLVSLLVASQGQIEELVLKRYIKNKYIRLENNNLSTFELSDTSDKLFDTIERDAEQIWTENKQKILAFFDKE